MSKFMNLFEYEGCDNADGSSTIWNFQDVTFKKDLGKIKKGEFYSLVIFNLETGRVLVYAGENDDYPKYEYACALVPSVV